MAGRVAFLLANLALSFYLAGAIWAVAGNLGCQVLSLALTAIFWGPWQAKLSKDPAGSQSVYLNKILKTHWIRTTLVNAYALILLAWTIQVLA